MGSASKGARREGKPESSRLFSVCLHKGQVWPLVRFRYFRMFSSPMDLDKEKTVLQVQGEFSREADTRRKMLEIMHINWGTSVPVENSKAL